MTATQNLGYLNTTVSAYSEHQLAKSQYRLNESARKHKEKMGRISLALNSNAMTDNEVQVRDASVRASAAIGLASRSDKAKAELSAAHAGVAGKSVDGTAQGLTQSFLRAHAARKRNTQSQLRASGKQRLNAELANIWGRDISVVIPPSSTSALLGLGVALFQQYDDNNPEGSKTADKLSRINK